ncbi:hypothetical protein [Pseudovibrio exalbescens]|nr:hypothetical protein [Pseudovibrio exalbescens]
MPERPNATHNPLDPGAGAGMTTEASGTALKPLWGSGSETRHGLFF